MTKNNLSREPEPEPKRFKKPRAGPKTAPASITVTFPAKNSISKAFLPFYLLLFLWDVECWIERIEFRDAYVDDHDPDGRVQHLRLILHERQRGDALKHKKQLLLIGLSDKSSLILILYKAFVF